MEARLTKNGLRYVSYPRVWGDPMFYVDDAFILSPPYFLELIIPVRPFCYAIPDIKLRKYVPPPMSFAGALYSIPIAGLERSK